MIKINVILNNISWTKYLKNPSSFIDQKLRSLNKKNISYKKNILVCSLLLSGTKEIKKLNKKFRNKDKSTDILSFPFYKSDELKKKIKKEKEIYLGDIIINLNKIKSKNNKSKFYKEFNKLWVHGLIHLFGNKHYKEKDFKIMNKLEKKYLKHLN
tara:strand:+ start:1302 stop:1766 length:465 start_codon:yes stop_codon:yes gene_type:complete